jgi:hypothetical protein
MLRPILGIGAVAIALLGAKEAVNTLRRADQLFHEATHSSHDGSSSGHTPFARLGTAFQTEGDKMMARVVRGADQAPERVLAVAGQAWDPDAMARLSDEAIAQGEGGGNTPFGRALVPAFHREGHRMVAELSREIRNGGPRVFTHAAHAFDFQYLASESRSAVDRGRGARGATAFSNLGEAFASQGGRMISGVSTEIGRTPQRLDARHLDLSAALRESQGAFGRARGTQGSTPFGNLGNTLADSGQNILGGVAREAASNPVRLDRVNPQRWMNDAEAAMNKGRGKSGSTPFARVGDTFADESQRVLRQGQKRLKQLDQAR